jgi:hypothetical protein
MRAAKSYLLVTIWVFCAIGAIAVGAMLWKATSHPLAEGDPWAIGLIYCVPYIVLTCSGLFAFQRFWLLILNACVTGFTFLTITAACYQSMETSLFLLNARAAGQHAMNCGPPLSFFVMPLTYGMAFVVTLITIILGPRAKTTEPLPDTSFTDRGGI